MAKPRRRTPPKAADPGAVAQKLFEKLCVVARDDPDSLPGRKETVGNPITLAPRVPDAAEMTRQQLAGVERTSAKWKERVMKPRKNPIEAAKAAEGKFEDSMRRALTEKRFGKGLAQVDEEAMYETIAATPDDAVAQGVRKRQRKIKAKYDKLQPLLLANALSIDSMPNATPEDRVRRMVTNLENMRTIKGKMRE